MNITINEILEHDPCKAGLKRLYAQLGEDFPKSKPFDLRDLIGGKNTFEDVAWCLGHRSSVRIMRGLALRCARTVLPLFENARPDDTRPRMALLSNISCVITADVDACYDAANATNSIAARAAARCAATALAAAATDDTPYGWQADDDIDLAVDAVGMATEAAEMAKRPRLIAKIQAQLKRTIRHGGRRENKLSEA